ncbi:MAG: CocE/NonD family hydrolase [Solirubrobacteraceae bacterium]
MLVENDVAIPMRDGVVLRADVYRPETDRPIPAVLNRTCYDRSFRLTQSAALDPDLAVEAGLAVVCQDVRGQFSSDGDFYPFVTEAQDGHDTVEWVAGRPWCNGAVMMAGRSYSGATQWLAAAERPTSLVAICPIATGSNYYDGWIYQGGAFQLGFNLFWAQMMTAPRTRSSLGEQFRHLPITEPPLLDCNEAARFYRDWLAHPTDDEYWQAVSINRVYDRVDVPAFNIGGWYDLLLKGTLENYRRMRSEGGSERARSGTRLLIGPWAHGTTYGAYPDHVFPEFGGEDKIDLARLQISFFRQHLGDSDAALDPSRPVRIFVMGENRWRDEADWPLPQARQQRWFLHSDGDAAGAGGTLSEDPPAAEPPDAYVYQPADPAPTLGGPTSLPAALMRTNSGPIDQRPLEQRADVLLYSSEPLAEPLEVTGPVTLMLHAATSARDTDFVAKLCDVAGDGVSRILAEGILRARYREGYTRAVANEPGQAYEYVIDLVATSNVFLPGHCIRLLVTSSSFPRFDRNPNTGNQLGADGPADLVQARQTILHDDAHPSHLRLPVMQRRASP